MTVIAFGIYTVLSKKTKHLTAQIIGAATAEIWMTAGYLIFESFIYGFVPSLVNVPANAVQGVAGIVISIPLVKIFKKAKLF